MNKKHDDSRLHDRDFLTSLLRQWRTKLGYFSIFAAMPAIMGSTASDASAAEDLIRPVSAPPEAGRMKKRARGLIKFFGKEEFLRRQAGTFAQRVNENLASVSGLLTGSDSCPGAAITPGKYTGAAPFTDSGDTTGANDTVNYLCSYWYYCYSGTSVNGPDHVYSFTLTSRLPTAEIRLTPTSSSYDPLIYVLDGRWNGCPNGTGQLAYVWWGYGNGSGPGGAELFPAINNIPLNIPMYLFVDSQGSAPVSGGPYTLRIQDAGIGSGSRSKLDFNGDMNADISLFRPSDGTWYSRSALNPAAAVSTPFGLATDKLVPGHYDGDSRTDIAIFRDGTWWWLASSDNSAHAAQFGGAGDTPVPADYTGDGRTDLAIYRGGEWWIYDLATGQYRFAQFGLPGDRPVAGDFDSDGFADLAVYRDGTWYIYKSRLGISIVPLGIAGDKPVPADYDGDGALDPAVFRNGYWYAAQSTGGLMIRQFGLPDDIPVPADYQGWGAASISVFRNGLWYTQTGAGMTVWQFGKAGDRPLSAPD